MGLPARHNTIVRLHNVKTVGFLGGVCLLFNAMTGAGIPFTPSLFATLGWVPPFFLFILFAVISAFSVLFIIESMQAMPGNRHFQGTVEFATLINFFFGPAEHIIGQLILYGAIQSQAMNNIVLSAQTFDHIFVDVFHKTCAIAFPGNGVDFGWYCVSNDQSTAAAVALGASSPFGDQPILFSMGFLTVVILCIPLARSNMDDNIGVQIAAFVVTLIVSAEWFVESTFTLNKSRVQPISLSPAFASLLGPIILNFSCTLFVPSWINLKRKSVNAQMTVWVTMFSAVLLFGIIGVFPALAFDDLKLLTASDTPKNIINIFTDPHYTPHFVVNKLFCYVFSIVMLLPAIPVSFIISEQNIGQNFNIDSPVKQWAVKFITFILPWLICIPMQTGTALGTFINWTGVLLISPANFVIPFVIYLKCLRFRREYNQHRTLSSKQTSILKQVHTHSTTIVNFLDKRAQRGNTFLGRFQTKKTAGGGGGGGRSSSHSPTPNREPSPDPYHHAVAHQSLRGPIRVVEWDDGTEDEARERTGSNADEVDVETPVNTMSRQLDVEGWYHGSLHLQVPDGTMRSYHAEVFNESPRASPLPQDDDDEEEAKAAAADEEFWLKDTVPDPEIERLQKKRTQRFLRQQTGGGGGGGSGRDPSPFRALIGSASLYGVAAPASPSSSSVPMISMVEDRGELGDPLFAPGATSPANYGAFKASGTDEEDVAAAQDYFDDGEYDIAALREKAKVKGAGKSMARKATLPSNDLFVSPTFNAVPYWLPIGGKPLALGLLGVTSVLTVTVIILQILSAASS
ncbi:hypothetical protein BDR26DRAFT_822498 [Obelidium mucronatum]|nr:hypothetical protein BDR26DRAFT_822498 [Obelidium mucronatum]